MNENKFDKEKKDASDKMNVKMSSETGHAQTPVNNTGKKTRFNGLMYFIFVVSVSVILACLAWAAATDVLALKADNVEATVVLAKDSFEYSEKKEKDEDGKEVTKKTHTADVGYVADKLKEAGIIKYKWLFKLYCGFSNADEKLDPGTYELKSSYDYRALVMKMQTGSGAMVALKITFPEGYTMHDIFKKLDAEGVCDYDELMDAAANATFNYSFLEGTEKGDASRLEGFLFPDTYEFYVGMQASSAINKMLENFYYKQTAEMLQKAADMNMTMQGVVNVASLIEKEAANDEERATIASVIYNRIYANMPIGIDASILYPYPDHEGAPTAEMLQTDTPYNSRMHTGLPPTPICNPGLASINAALNPESTSYYYYALDTNTGTHRFFTNETEFNNFVATQDYS